VTQKSQEFEIKLFRKVLKRVVAMYLRKGDNKFMRKSDVNSLPVDREKNWKKTEKYD